MTRHPSGTLIQEAASPTRTPRHETGAETMKTALNAHERTRFAALARRVNTLSGPRARVAVMLLNRIHTGMPRPQRLATMNAVAALADDTHEGE